MFPTTGFLPFGVKQNPHDSLTQPLIDNEARCEDLSMTEENQTVPTNSNETILRLQEAYGVVCPTTDQMTDMSEELVSMLEANRAIFESNLPCSIEYKKFPEKVDKVQRRIGGVSQQRLKQDEAEVIIDINALAQVLDVIVKVERTKEIAHKRDENYIDPEKLEAKLIQSTTGKYRLHLNLDSVYENADGKRIYELVKNNIREINRFHLTIQLIYIDNSTSNEIHTKSFKIIGKPTKKASNGDDQVQPTPNGIPGHVPQDDIQDLVLSGIKRKRTESNETNGTNGSFLSDATGSFIMPEQYFQYGPGSNVSSNTNGSSGYTTGDSSPQRQREDSFVQYSRVAADRIEAQVADIGELIVAKPIQTRGADIAYHFVFKDPDAHPEVKEGEIVGLFADKLGGRVLAKLTRENSPYALIKGVITRSAYIEANKCPDDVRTETICMFGIVPVRVKGTVHQNDQLYATAEDPGVAVSEFNLKFKPSLTNDASAIGVAWETKKAANEREINMVQSFVSITMEPFHNMMHKSLAVYDNEISSIKKSRKAGKKCRWLSLAFTVVFLCLLATLLYQLFMPGSALRYARCEKGSIKDHTATFSYIPYGTITDVSKAKGVLFKWPVLKKKEGWSSVDKINGTGFSYYLNLDRCAYGGKRRTEDKVLNLKTISGPIIFAVNEDCTLVFYYSDNKATWCQYKTTRSLKCHPTRHKSKTSTYVPPKCTF